MPRAIHLLIKPASGLCNLRCRYCFYCDITQKREQASYGIMSLETLEAVIEKALEAARTECTIAYQGGEPTLAGLDFFRKSIEMQKKHNRRKITIHNAIQTNGMVIDEEWARFFAEPFPRGPLHRRDQGDPRRLPGGRKGKRDLSSGDESCLVI